MRPVRLFSFLALLALTAAAILTPSCDGHRRSLYVPTAPPDTVFVPSPPDTIRVPCPHRKPCRRRDCRD